MTTTPAALAQAAAALEAMAVAIRALAEQVHTEQTAGERTLTHKEVAERLQCSASQVRALVREGDLVGISVGRLARVRVSALEDYMRERASR
jgi:excisionase family DNA binding protein